jgi:hypothetical protein
MWKTYQKIHSTIDAFEYFTTKQWMFNNDNTQKLWKKMSPQDKHLFKFDVTLIDWEEVLFTTVKSLRLYVMEDPFLQVEEAVARYRRYANI